MKRLIVFHPDGTLAAGKSAIEPQRVALLDSLLTLMHGIGIDEMLFVGDALFPGGNDAPDLEAGVRSLMIGGPDETELVIRTLVACCDVTLAETSEGRA